MKEVIAIIRRNKIQETKAGLLGIGVPALTMLSVEGRGRQKGLAEQPDPFVDDVEIETRLRFIPKRMVSAVVNDEDVPKVVDAIVRINRTGNIGDGKIFVCPVCEAIRVRTGETNEIAI